MKIELTAGNQAGSAWQPLATSNVFARTRASTDNEILAIARQAFETAVPPESHPAGIRFITVFGDLQQLIDGELGSVTIKVKGYIQATLSQLGKF